MGKGTRQCHIGAALYSRPQEEGKKCTIICSIPGFPGVVGTCACNTFFLLLPGLGTRLGSYTMSLNVHTTSSVNLLWNLLDSIFG